MQIYILTNLLKIHKFQNIKIKLKQYHILGVRKLSEIF